MNILVGALYERDSQNPKIMNILCDEWKKAGHNVVRFYPCTSKGKYHEMRSVNDVYAFRFPDSEKYNLFINEISKNKKNIPLLLLCFLKHPILAFRFILKRNNIYDLESSIIKNEIERVCNARKIDVIVVGSNPFYLPFGVAKANCECKKIWYQMDPHAFNGIVNNKNLNNAIINEEYTYEKMDSIYVQRNAIEQLKSTKCSKYLSKVKPAYFPLLRLNQEVSPNMEFFRTDTINCVYAGALMLPIRRPEFMLNLFSKLSNQNIHLYIWCGNLTEEMKAELLSLLPDNVHFCGKLSQNEMIHVLSAADVLVNLGNTETNQFPSKVLDYISLRKPILNIYKNINCPTLNVLNDYPVVLNIHEKNDSKIEVSDVAEFIKTSRTQRIDKEMIASSFSLYEPTNVARGLLEDIEID